MGCWSCSKTTYVEYTGTHHGRVGFYEGDGAVKRILRGWFPPVDASIRGPDGTLVTEEVPSTDGRVISILSRWKGVEPDAITCTVVLEADAEIPEQVEERERSLWRSLAGLGLGLSAILMVLYHVRLWVREVVERPLRERISSLQQVVLARDRENSRLGAMIESLKRSLASAREEIRILRERPPGPAPLIDQDDLDYMDHLDQRELENARLRREVLEDLYGPL